MKVVIEIDETRFKDIQRIAEVQIENSHFQTAEQIIAKGVLIEQEPVLDKIRAEITELDNKVCRQFLIEDVDKEVHHTYRNCLNIIDKYRKRG